MTGTNTIHIDATDGLDPIVVYLENYLPRGRGMITVVCYGNAWSAYFGSMGDGRSIEAFVAYDIDPEYLAGKLATHQFPPPRGAAQRELAYLKRIALVVQLALLQLFDEGRKENEL